MRHAATLGPGLAAVLDGFLCRCPACGRGRLFGRFLKIAPACTSCGLAFHHHRADDFPPYIVMFVVGHLVGYGIYMSETRFDDVPLWLHALLWPALVLVLCLALLQPVKGAVVGLQFALGMHGFPGVQGPPPQAGFEIERRSGERVDPAGRERRAAKTLAEPPA